MRLGRIALVALLGWGAWYQWHTRPVPQAAGILAAEDPVQRNLSTAPIPFKAYTLTPRADFDITARILSRERYLSGREADLSPLDLALGWGPMSDTAVLEKIDISQGGRFYFWSTQEPPIPLGDIATHSANMHMIPASAAIRSQLLDLRTGEVIHLAGKLVDVDASDGWHWRTSLTRQDTGAGACEVVLVEALSVQR